MTWIEVPGREVNSKEEVERMNLHFEVSKIIQYLKEREKKDGGFSLVPDLYPDIEDTYYAIRTLQRLKVKINPSFVFKLKALG